MSGKPPILPIKKTGLAQIRATAVREWFSKKARKGRAMINLDDELVEDYLTECREHLAEIESDLLAMKKGGAAIDENLANRVFRAVHSVKAGAALFELGKIRELSHKMEDAMAQIRSRQIVPTPERIHVLLRASDRLSELLADPGASQQADITEVTSALAGMGANQQTSAAERSTCAGGQTRGRGMPLRMLLVEDNFASRLLLQTFLARYGECHIAVNGREAVEAFRSALELGQSYDLVCMDIMMPEMDGREAVSRIRASCLMHRN
jgi:HPt (histidine-containing phosphotransfer) domain-containing protein